MKQISGIYIYPVKSLGGVELSESAVGPRGLACDRQWMVVDMKGMFITQRKVPKMALIQPVLREGELVLAHRRDRDDYMATPLSGPELDIDVPVQVWEDSVKAKLCREEVNEWLSDQLGTFCRLVYLPLPNARPLAEKYGRPRESTLFADSCPLLITGEAALQDLNSHLADPVPMDRFRPNLVFTGGAAYEEDEWSSFTISGVPFRGIRKCTRCKVINTDQTTAAVYQEPLATLATYRRDAQGVNFGLHATLGEEQGAALIRLGDQISA